MTERRCVCGWCPIELPDDPSEWTHHFLIVHNDLGYSVRYYPALTEEAEMASLADEGLP